MKKIVIVALMGLAPAALMACAQPQPPAAGAEATDDGVRKGPGRSGDWRGNASSFPYQQ